MQRRCLVSYRRFETTYRAKLLGPFFLTSEDETDRLSQNVSL